MDLDLKTLKSLVGLPARLNVEQAAVVLGFQPHDIPILVACGLLSPLGRRDRGKNTTKYFAWVDIDQRRTDAKWLSKATEAVQTRWVRRRAVPEAKAKGKAE